MKLKIKDRLLLLLCTLFVFAVGVGLVVLSIRQPNIVLDGANGSFFSWPRLAVIGVGFVLALCAVYLLVLPSKLRENRKGFVVQQTDNGELRIAIKAIENLVKKCVDMHEEMTLSSMVIQNARDGVTVDLRISLANNISIPLAVASLQKQIRQYLAVSSGIEVREVRVSVETTETGIGDSPYLVENQPAPAMKEKKVKKPLHQRIFGHEEAAATMPEAPAPEAPAENPETAEEKLVKEEDHISEGLFSEFPEEPVVSVTEEQEAAASAETASEASEAVPETASEESAHEQPAEENAAQADGEEVSEHE